MRRIVCRFDDESDFLRQFTWTRGLGADDAADFMFVGEFCLDHGEDITLTAMVSGGREQCHLQMTVLDAVPMCMDRPDGVRVYKHHARVVPKDAVWLLAFRQKMSTRRWIEELAA